MFVPRFNGDDIKSSPFYVKPYSSADMPNCTTYAMFRACELLQKQITNYQGYPTIDNHCFNRSGYGNACDWYRDWIWEKGQDVRLGAIACWSGTKKATGEKCHGHVAVVEQINEDGSFITSNSNYGGTFFYTQRIGSNKKLSSAIYNFTFEGFCYLPLKDTKRDETKWQIQVKVDYLRLRVDHSTDSDIITVAKNGEYFNIIDSYIGDYRWLKTEDNYWIATKNEWVDEYFTVNELDSLRVELREANKTIATLKDMNQALDDANKSLSEENGMFRDKINKIKEIIDE